MAYTIMIIDDSETIQTVLERTLKMTKLQIDEIIVAENGVVALEKLKEHWVDIVFTDINMPKMNGMEFIAKMKENSEYRQIPIVVISTEGSQIRIDELEKIGIQGYIRKPFTPEEIRDVILKTLGAWDAQRK